MDWLLILLRIIHIFSGVVWVGGAAYVYFYIEPTLNKLGPASEPFVDEIINKKKMSVFFMIAATLTVLGGVLVYWKDTGLVLDTMAQPTYLAFGLGGLCAIVAWLMGGAALGPAVKRVGQLAAEMKAAGGPPSADLLARMHAAQERVRLIGGIDLVLVALALLGMATARYLA